ncbi:MAG: hypothetical protein R3F00_13190 [Dokdonella sp.]
MLIPALALVTLVCSNAAPAIDGAYDPGYALGGRRTVSAAGYHSLVGVHLRPDRRALLAGSCSGFATNGSIVTTLCAAELSTEGALTDYGPPPADTVGGAVAMTELQPQQPGESFYANDSAIDGNGRLLIAAETIFNGSSRASLALLGPRGDVLAGVFVRAPGTNELDNGRFQAIIVDSENRAVVAGSVRRTNGRYSLLVMRFNSDLNPDPTFGNNGSVRVDYVDRNSNAADIEIDSQGRILVLCNQWETDFFATFNTLYRFTSTGAIDTTFGSGGETTIGSTIDAQAGGLAIDASDRPIVLGTTEDPFQGDTDLYVARFLPDGNPDISFYPIPGFGGGYRVIEAEVELSLGPNEAPGDVVIQTNGKILLVATALRIDGGGGSYFFSMRLLANGNNDPGYGVGGAGVGTYAGAPSAGFGDTGVAQVLDPTGFLYVAGESRSTDQFSIPAFGIARLQNMDAVEPSLFANGFD